MEREEKPVCNIVDFYAEGRLAQMSGLMAVIPYEIPRLVRRIYIFVSFKVLSR